MATTLHWTGNFILYHSHCTTLAEHPTPNVEFCRATLGKSKKENPRSKVTGSIASFFARVRGGQCVVYCIVYLPWYGFTVHCIYVYLVSFVYCKHSLNMWPLYCMRTHGIVRPERKILLNPSKKKAMLFNPHRIHNFVPTLMTGEGENIYFGEEKKILGHILRPDMKTIMNTEYICKRVHKRMWILRRLISHQGGPVPELLVVLQQQIIFLLQYLRAVFPSGGLWSIRQNAIWWKDFWRQDCISSTNKYTLHLNKFWNWQEKKFKN